MRRLDALDEKMRGDAKFLKTEFKSNFAGRSTKHAGGKRRSREELRWSRFRNLPPEEMLDHVRDNVFPFIVFPQERRADLHAVYAGRCVHHSEGVAARGGRRDHRRALCGDGARAAGFRPAVSGCAGGFVRVSVGRDSDRRKERTVPHAAAHHPDDCVIGGSKTRRRNLRSGVRDRRIPAGRVPTHPHSLHEPGTSVSRRRWNRTRYRRRPAD